MKDSAELLDKLRARCGPNPKVSDTIDALGHIVCRLRELLGGGVAVRASWGSVRACLGLLPRGAARLPPFLLIPAEAPPPRRARPTDQGEQPVPRVRRDRPGRRVLLRDQEPGAFSGPAGVSCSPPAPHLSPSLTPHVLPRPTVAQENQLYTSWMIFCGRCYESKFRRALLLLSALLLGSRFKRQEKKISSIPCDPTSPRLALPPPPRAYTFASPITRANTRRAIISDTVELTSARRLQADPLPTSIAIDELARFLRPRI